MDLSLSSITSVLTACGIIILCTTLIFVEHAKACSTCLFPATGGFGLPVVGKCGLMPLGDVDLRRSSNHVYDGPNDRSYDRYHLERVLLPTYQRLPSICQSYVGYDRFYRTNKSLHNLVSNAGNFRSDDAATTGSISPNNETKYDEGYVNQEDRGSQVEQSEVVSSSMIAAIGFYKQIISPLLPPACRFVPTCSQYGVQAIEEFGPTIGILLIAWRLLRCSPIGGKGYDPPKWPPVPYRYSSY
jgi:uncharacterized protein